MCDSLGHLAALPHRIGLRETESQSSLVAPPSRAWEVYRPFRRATFGQTSLRHLRGGEFEMERAIMRGAVIFVG
eukprot:1359850-Amorphochlora_amoeboformis.AAC.3